MDRDTKSMVQKTVEGTWEEIARRGTEFAGRRVRITVLEAPESLVPLDRALAQLIENAEQLAGTIPPVATSYSAETWSEGVIEKYRRQGFTL
jgi:hypothetical protein